MSAADEAVVRRFYGQMCNERKNEIAEELFTPGHRLHDPQVPAADGPAGVAAVVAQYQEGVDGHWAIGELFSTRDRVVVRWTGSGSIHRMEKGKIAETWEVWDTLSLLQQIGVAPGA